VNSVQKYELVYALRTDRPDAELQARAEKAASIIVEHKGEITERSHWGVRRLAFEIDHQAQGDYMFFKFRAEGTVVADLDRFLRQDDACLRHMVVVDGEWHERNRANQARVQATLAANAARAPRPGGDKEDKEDKEDAV
jgi:small subunit ribosomal protein S6